jgi:hypothetical protein
VLTARRFSRSTSLSVASAFSVFVAVSVASVNVFWPNGTFGFRRERLLFELFSTQ